MPAERNPLPAPTAGVQGSGALINLNRDQQSRMGLRAARYSDLTDDEASWLVLGMFSSKLKPRQPRAAGFFAAGNGAIQITGPK
jgi:hypothetical protein